MALKLFEAVVFENDVHQCNRILTINWLIFFSIEAPFIDSKWGVTLSVRNRISETKVVPMDKMVIVKNIQCFPCIFG